MPLPAQYHLHRLSEALIQERLQPGDGGGFGGDCLAPNHQMVAHLCSHLAAEFIQCQYLFQQLRQTIQREHGLGIAERLGGIGVGLYEKAVHADCSSRPRVIKDIVRHAACHIGAGVAGDAHDVGDIKYHRVAQGAHLGQIAKVADEVTVAEHGAPLGEQELVVAGLPQLADGDGEISCSHELGFLHIDGLAGASQCQRELGLLGKIGGKLQDVQHFGGRFGFGGGVHIGEDGDAQAPLDLRQLRQPHIQPWTLERGSGGAVILEIARLEHIVDAQLAGDVPHLFAYLQPQLQRFQHARSANEQKRVAAIGAGGKAQRLGYPFHSALF